MTFRAKPDFPFVSVIVPTTCELKRSAAIERAIGSLMRQRDVSLEIIVVVNGSKFDRTLLGRLKKHGKLKVLRCAEANVSVARYMGVREARGDFFCFLDDDDELLPDTVHQRAGMLVRHPEVDVLATNGYIHADGDLPLVPASLSTKINTDLAGSFLLSNWFPSAGPMFRRSRVETSLFDMQYKYFEWTYLFFLLLSKGKAIRYDDSLAFRIHQGTPSSASKSDDYHLSNAALYADLQRLALGARTKRALSKKYLVTLNETSNLYWTRGDLRNAWRYHLKCVGKGGWRFLPYTRHLILGSVWPSPTQSV